MKRGEWAHLAVAGAEYRLRVTPAARRDTIEMGEDGTIRLHVTAAPEDGRATAAVVAALAHALGVAKTRLVLVRGATSRDKVLRLD